MTTKPKAAKPAKKQAAKKTTTDKPKRGRGRPKGSGSKYTPELAQEICARLSKGEPFAQISRDEHMPSATAVQAWQIEHKEFALMYSRARDAGYDQIAVDMLLIADTQEEGVETTIDDLGKTTEKRYDMLGHRKLRIDTRMRLLKCWDPKRYGDRVALAGDAESPLEINQINMVIVPVKKP